MPLIEIRDLYKIFGTRPMDVLALLRNDSELSGLSREAVMKTTGHAVALQRVSLSIDAGEIFAVMGLSGSGKSTLVRCLNRLIEPTAGEILVGGVDVLQLDAKALLQFQRHKMSMVFQRFGLFPHRTVLQNVAFGLEVQGMDKKSREERAMSWLETVGLTGWEERFPSQLSGGMQQRVGLARALCTDPEILLMDEAFSALDPLIRREMQDELVDIQKKLKKTIIFITHDIDEALRIGDRIAILKDGLLVQTGTPEEILARPANDYVAEFTRDVNRSRVLSAASIMSEPAALVSEQNDPAAALRLVEDRNLSGIFTVDQEQKYQGFVTLAAIASGIKKGVKNLGDLKSNRLVAANPDASLEEILPASAAHLWPIPITDNQGVLVGEIPRTAILSALAGKAKKNGHAGPSL